ncbi:hypothetical protein Pla100_49270 [Neorhodopirellula pilleata]|uniref:Uncharacterized protein n=1 Tax=Neorhodopirellula pilleata TaxID=2714738 RepID=A0A5C5ZY06_9BACT|nr:hypothetical protein Pla100_49270 [Neorhodopirellula pilleata]
MSERGNAGTTVPAAFTLREAFVIPFESTSWSFHSPANGMRFATLSSQTKQDEQARADQIDPPIKLNPDISRHY